MAAILFDLYGTLIDISTDEDSPHFWNTFTRKVKYLHPAGPEYLREEYQKLCKDLELETEEIDILKVFQNMFQISKEESIRVAKIFRSCSTKYLRLYRGVKTLLKRLKKEGHHLYVLSNAQEAFTLQEVKHLKLHSYFEGIALSSKYGVKKPNPEFFIRAIKDFQTEEKLWMIGNDYDCDIVPAKKLGIQTIFIESNLTPSHPETDRLIGFNAKEIQRRILA